jgi:ADP-ribosylglycohydrolase
MGGRMKDRQIDLYDKVLGCLLDTASRDAIGMSAVDPTEQIIALHGLEINYIPTYNTNVAISEITTT